MSTERYRGIAGERPTPQSQEEERRPKLRSKVDFTFVADPRMWDVYITEAGPEILPSLTHHPHDGCLFGNDPRGGHGVGLARREQAGKVGVPRDMTVVAFGDSGVGYTHSFTSKDGHKHFTHVWKRPYTVGDDVFWEHDREGYYAFLRQVRDDVLGGIDPKFKRSLQQRLRTELQWAKRRENKRDQALLEQKLTAFEPEPEPEPEKKTSKKGSTKKAAA